MIKWDNYDELFRLVLDRSECHLERDGDAFAVYGDDFRGNQEACLGTDYTKASEVFDILYENITYCFIDDFKYELGLDANAEWDEVLDAFKERYCDEELDDLDATEFNALSMLVMPDDKLNAAVDLNAVYERALEEQRLMHNLAENANASLIIEEFLKVHNFCILPVDTGGFFLYDAEHDCLHPPFVFTAEDQIYDDISVTKNEDNTYHIEYVGDEEPSQLFKDDCGDMYEDYNDAIASCAISGISSLAIIVDTYDEKGKIVKDIWVSGNPVLYDIVDKYDLRMFANDDSFARAADAIKKAAPDLYEKHRLSLQVIEIYGAPNVDDKLNINDVYQMQRTRGENLFDKQKQSIYKKSASAEKTPSKVTEHEVWGVF